MDDKRLPTEEKSVYPNGTDGFLVIDKPAGCSSHDVVARVRKALGLRKIGHAGTLDPDATGLLILCVGRATRLVEYLMDIPKAYEVGLRLGEETDTEDASGRVIRRCELTGISAERVRSEIMGFQGTIEQVPPMFSALKEKGRRLYEYAREGREVARKPRRVTLYEIRNLRVELPVASFGVRCSRGTYVRSLCRDIGAALGVGAHLVTLRRIECGSFSERDAHRLSDIEEMERPAARALLLPMDTPLGHFERVTVCSLSESRVCRGQPLREGDLIGEFPAGETDALLRVYNERGRFLAVAEPKRQGGVSPQLTLKKVFC